ncbi:MAG: ArsR family transcriptional regulator [Candidatus Bathyarchaeota archaeon]|nr:ArsR family transcriptional regulator [Candidatus Bathyarchaeota archaeon]
MERLCDLFFDFSNEDRLQILYSLRETPMTVTNLSRELNLTTQEASRHLSRLGEMGLTLKDPNGLHHLSPFGMLSLQQLESFRFTSKHRDYFRSHDLSGLPPEFISRLGELAESEYIDDVMVVFHRINQVIKDADEHVHRLTDRYIITAQPAQAYALQKGVQYRLIEPEDIVVPPEFVNPPIVNEALRSGQFMDHVVDELKVFMALSEKELAVVCFPGTDGKMDYRGFSAKDEKAIKWTHDLFNYYWEGSVTRTTPLPSHRQN